MFVATAILSSVFAALLVVSGIFKLRANPDQLTTMETVGFPVHRVPLLAAAEIAGAVGLVAGLFWWPIGVAAAIGTVLYFVGAVGSHLRVKDPGYAPAAFMLVLAIAVLVLRLVTI
ncbi:MAG: hypothetical protein JWR83_1027 [Aeromicrobium sp.]|nr:hypothetical protein [Aeromicrobium sp.]